MKHGYIGVRVDNSTKIKGLPAAYFLTPKGMRTLAALPEHKYITMAVITGSYKDRNVSQAYIDQTLRTYTQGTAMAAAHSGLRIFPKRDMAKYSYFPKAMPDLFVSLMADAKPKRYFLDVVPASLPSKVLFQRIISYIEFFDDGGWASTKSEIPSLLVSCENAATERRVRRTIAAALNEADSDEDIEVYTTTFNAIAHLEDTKAIWTSLDDPDELLAINDI